MGELTLLRTVPTKINHEAIEVLERWLKQARSGELVGFIGYAEISGAQYDCVQTTGIDMINRLGALSRMAYNIHQVMNGGGE